MNVYTKHLRSSAGWLSILALAFCACTKIPDYCGDENSFDFRNQSCCGGYAYYSATHKCVSGKIVDINTPTPTLYTIMFDANGGTVTPTSGTTDEDGKLTSLPTPTMAGYTFNGWFTTAVSDTTVTTNYVFSAVTTIYAQWTEDNNCTSAGVCKSKLMLDGKVWMTENLNIKTGKSWCYKDSNSYCNKYGRLYDWETAKTACPSEWHLPSYEEWDALVTVVGHKTEAGTKLKSEIGWSDEGNGTNDFGFSALPGGSYDKDDRYGSHYFGIGVVGNWWIAPEVDEDYAYIRSIYCYWDGIETNGIYDDFATSGAGFSVRCVRDAEDIGTDPVVGNYTLSIYTNPINGGSVSRSPDKTSYIVGEQVTVTATVATGYNFVAWSGVSTSTNASIVVIMYRDLTLTANFTQYTDIPDGMSNSKVMPDGKVWMTENLNVATRTGSWCYNDSVSNCDKYGRLYNWETAKTVCPSGWRLPSTAEWDALVTAAGGEYVAGDKLRSKTGWYYMNGVDSTGTDDFGFSALPGGQRGYTGFIVDYPEFSIRYVGRLGFWWTATPTSVRGPIGSGDAYGAGAYGAYYWMVGYNYVGGDVFENTDSKKSGFSVRCVKDN